MLLVFKLYNLSPDNLTNAEIISLKNLFRIPKFKYGGCLLNVEIVKDKYF